MKIGETNARNLIEYLENFEPDDQVVFILADTSNRQFLTYWNVSVLTDTGHPVIAIDVKGSEPFSDQLSEIADMAERLEAAN